MYIVIFRSFISRDFDTSYGPYKCLYDAEQAINNMSIHGSRSVYEIYQIVDPPVQTTAPQELAR